jgi:hypothetical protein
MPSALNSPDFTVLLEEHLMTSLEETIAAATAARLREPLHDVWEVDGEDEEGDEEGEGDKLLRDNLNEPLPGIEEVLFNLVIITLIALVGLAIVMQNGL